MSVLARLMRLGVGTVLLFALARYLGCSLWFSVACAFAGLVGTLVEGCLDLTIV